MAGKPEVKISGQINAWQKKPNATDQKFKAAQERFQKSIEKLAENYESSSEEEEIESIGIIGKITRNYPVTSENRKDLERTQTFLEESLVSGATTCLICIGTVKRIDAIWSCLECYCFFHLLCIQRWSKDSIIHQKRVHEDQNPNLLRDKYNWGCPKCRHEYEPGIIPTHYECFCGKARNPPYHPWLPPHSCGDTCGKKLNPMCGHKCVLLCHPGPCPPCPKTVTCSCYCGAKRRSQRCSNKNWACVSTCDKLLGCGRHKCSKKCHDGECDPCPKQSEQKCECGSETTLRECAKPKWQCKKICGKSLFCRNHKCEIICHAGFCPPCPLTKIRECPCGKRSYQLPCTEDTPTCGDTCEKGLECGVHKCLERCHRQKCGNCLEMVIKKCRCGLHSKELPCPKEYLCDTKCKQIKDCQKHPCNRKCCDGNCSPCEKPCGRNLRCGIHKCTSACHRGPCYPCPIKAEIKCRCGDTRITVPCGRQKRTKPPRCHKLCRIPPNCHHPKREFHRCHFGDCTPCRQICNKKRAQCVHLCPAVCHSAVLIEVEENEKPSMPWEKKAPQLTLQCLPCPDCLIPMPVTCLGEHETADWPCFKAVPNSCGRLCGRRLACGNHTCSLDCHAVESGDSIHAGTNCEQCESQCAKPRPDGCPHMCPKACHPENCPPCTQMLRLKCHCSLNQVYIRCGDWTDLETRNKMMNCGNQCPKLFNCGHRCRATCHDGPCPGEDQCHKKVKVTCACKSLKKDFRCDVIRKGEATVKCTEECKSKLEEANKIRGLQEKLKREEEEKRNKKELEEFNKKFQSKKKYREPIIKTENQEHSLLRKYWFIALSFIVTLFGIYLVSYNV